MKTKLLVIWLALLCLSASARAQVFDAGYTFTYYFTSLPTFHAPIAELETGLFLLPGFQNVTATIQWEIFDSLPAGVPAHSGILKPGDGAYIGLFDQTWLDGAGS